MAELNKHAGIRVGVAIVVGLLTLACAREQPAEERAAERARFAEARDKLAKEVERYIAVTGNVAEPLAKLNEEQVASVVALSYIARSVELAHLASTRLPQGTVTQFKDKLVSISPGLGRIVDVESPTFACMDESLACVIALAGCASEDPPRGDEECYESWGPCAEHLYCLWPKLEAGKGRINDIFGGLKPPKPIPWPE